MSNNKKYVSQVPGRTIGAKQRGQKNNKKFTKSQVIVFVLMLIWSISSIFGSLSFFGVKADNVDTNYIFNGANYFLVTTSWNNNGTVYYDGGAHSLSIDTSIARMPNDDESVPYDTKPCINFTSFWVSNQNRLNYYTIADDDITYLPLSYYTLNNLSYIVLDYSNSTDRFVGDYWLGYPQEEHNEYTGRYGHVLLDVSPSFNCNVYSVSFTGSLTYELLDVPLQTIYGTSYYLVNTVNTVTYTDTDENTCVVKYLSTYSFRDYDRYTRGYVTWDNRTYYLNDGLTDSEQYRIGYTSGYNDGKNAFNGSGYDDGFNAGKEVGYNQGKQEGIASANEYSWLGLIGAVVDVPLQAFTSLFNFNILGINMLGFVSSIFTILILIVVVKICLGGGF